jgi:hypothetical protein
MLAHLKIDFFTVVLAVLCTATISAFACALLTLRAAMIAI